MTPEQPQEHEQKLMTCVHCGLCLNSCPTYLETGSEADSPRGRILLMRALHEGKLHPQDLSLNKHLDLCLGCRACETACPSGVPYIDILETARENIAGHSSRLRVKTLSKDLLLGFLTRPSHMRMMLNGARAAGVTTMPNIAAQALAGKQVNNHSLSPTSFMLSETEYHPLPAFTSAMGQKRARIELLTGCVMSVLYNDIHKATISVLSANGCEVLVNNNQGCCGALHEHQGNLKQARYFARNLLDAFANHNGVDAFITNSAGCGSSLKHYASLLQDDPEYAERASEFATKVKDVHEYLVELGWNAPMKQSETATVAAYHDACHLVHGQKVIAQPRQLLSQIPGLQLIDLPESEICCGSAGIYNFTEPEMAKRLQERKIANIIKTGAAVIAAANPGCLSWIEAGAKEQQLPMRLVHPVVLLDEALDKS